MLKRRLFQAVKAVHMHDRIVLPLTNCKPFVGTGFSLFPIASYHAIILVFQDEKENQKH